MSGISILIVEDEAIVAADLAGKLRRLDYEVVGITADGLEAVDLAGVLRPQLVIMDIQLEGAVDGIEAAGEIRRRYDVPVIYLTAHSDPATLTRAKLSDPFGYILKPFEERELATQIELAVYKHRADRDVREQREWLRVTLKSIGDAVIATDACGRITFVNPVAEALTGWMSDEAAGQSLDVVFRVINEVTGGALEEPIGRVLREGVTVPLANHASLIRKDGRRVPIEDSAAPIMDSTGRVVGAVLVFHDVTEKRRAENALRESEERLRLFIEHAPAALAMFDRAMRYVSVSHRWLMDFNLGERDLRGLSHYEVFPEVPDEWKAIHQRALAGEVLRKERDLFVRADGSEQWLRWEVRPWHDSRGAVAGIVIFSEDVTERKRAEDALRESEERFRVMADSIQQLAWIAGADGYIHWYNQRWYDYTGTMPEEMKGWGWQSVHDPVALPEVLDIWKTSIATGKPFDMVFPLRGADGVYRQFLTRAQPVLNAAGEVVQWCGTNTDITERTQMEVELRRSEAEFRLLSETAGNLLASETPQALVEELCTKVMRHLDCHAFFNFLVDEAAGKLRLNAFAGIPGEAAKAIEWLDFGVAVCGYVAASGERIVAEGIFHTPDLRTDLVKSYGIQAYACHPLKVRKRIIGTLSFGTRSRPEFLPRELAVMKTVADQVAIAMERVDLIGRLRRSRDELETRVEERTAELKATLTKLEQSNEALREFTSIASHDLQEPLRKVGTFGGMLKEACGDSLGEKGNFYLDRVLNANRRMQTLLTTLLDYARLTTKAAPFMDVDLGRVIHEVLQDLEVRIETVGGEIHVGELPVVQADPTQMRQLFQNLIGNALKFHREGERPVIRISSSPEPDGTLKVLVEDNGIGFDEKFIETIFKPFNRLHGRSGPYEGSGMGLAICRKIVERHGGSISAESEPGKGSTFIIILPFGRQPG